MVRLVWNAKAKVVNHFNINGEKQRSIENRHLTDGYLALHRLKNDVLLSDTITSEDRIRTYSDGVLIINHIQPSDHGSYVCVISISNGTNIRSQPAVITVQCWCR
jgi:hypothetical protein